MSEILLESCFQALLQVLYTFINGLPEDTWSIIIRVGGICVSFISIIYGTYGFMTHKLSTWLKRDPSLLDYVCCCRIGCQYNLDTLNGTYDNSPHTPDDTPDDDQEESESML